jgi:hypothetical protein
VPAPQEPDVITVFLTGNTLGELKPCGCTEGQLGGLERRSAVFRKAAPSKRLIVDTGNFVEGDSEQDLIKFNIIVQAFGLLGYDAVNLTGKDAALAERLGLLDALQSGGTFITSPVRPDANLPAKFVRQMSLKGQSVKVTIGAFDLDSGPVEGIKEIFPRSPRGEAAERPDVKTANILILNRCDAAILSAVSQTGVVDCVVCPPQADEAELLGGAGDMPLVVSVGRFGKNVGRLQLALSQDGNNLQYSFSPVAVTEDLPQEPLLVELYKTYQQIVKDENLLERRVLFALPGELRYTSSDSCKHCHEYEYEKWSTKTHAHAYATLERVNSQYDPECVNCHVVGFEYESGFISPEKTPNLKDVGCENCHGPGSEHNRTEGKALTTQPQSDCTDCHTPEHSANYAGNEAEYREKIVHWREPNAPNAVKK